MSLRKKTLSIVILAFVLLEMLAALAMRLTLFQSYLDLEARDTIKNIRRAENELLDELSEMEATLGDWAWWTDTYQFVQGANDTYPEDNLYRVALLNLGVNLMWFGDSAGQEVQSLMVDLDSAGAAIPVTDSIRAHLASSPSLLERTDEPKTTSGIILLPEGPMLIASAPILTNEQNGPAAGTMIIGRYLNETAIQQVSDVMQLPLSLYRLDVPQLPDSVLEAQDALSRSTPFVSVPLDRNAVAGYTLLEDISGEPILMLSVTAPRDTFHQGEHSFGAFGMTMFAIDALIVAVVTVSFQKLVVSRVGRLSQQASEIAGSGDFSARLAVSGNDELTELTTAFNVVLQSLYEAHMALVDANDRLEDRVALRTAELKQANDRLTAEVEERARIQTDLAASLEDKEILLKEVHHRLHSPYPLSRMHNPRLSMSGDTL